MIELLKGWEARVTVQVHGIRVQRGKFGSFRHRPAPAASKLLKLKERGEPATSLLVQSLYIHWTWMATLNHPGSSSTLTAATDTAICRW